MKGYSFRSLTDLVLKIFKTKVNAGTGLSGGGSLEADRTLTVKYGTTSGTSVQGNDSRVVNALQKGNNLSEITNKASARSNLGLGTAATRNVGEDSGQVMQVGAFGLGSSNSPSVVPSGEDIRDVDKNGFYRSGSNDLGKPEKSTGMGVIKFGWSGAGWSTLLLSSPHSDKMWFHNTEKGKHKGWNEFHHTGNIHNSTGTSTDFPMSQKATTDQLNTKANTSTQVIAGTGLSGGGNLSANRTLNVTYGTAAGTAVQGNDTRVVNAASNATVNAKEAALEAKKADKAITITAGTGLSGGGTLAANRSFSVNYGTAAGTAAQGNDGRLSNSREWTAGTIDQAEAEAGTATTRRAFTAQRVRQAIVSWWNGVTGTFGRDLVTSANNIVARSKLGLGTTATRDVGTNVGQVVEVGAFGLGSSSSPHAVPQGEDIRDVDKNGFYRSGSNDLGKPEKSTGMGVIKFGWSGAGWSTLLLSSPHSDKMWFHNTRDGVHRGWNEFLHTGNLLQTAGNSSEFPMSQKATTDALNTKAASSHTHPWSQVTGQPATATRWPSFDEVTGKPTNYATTWNSVAAKPAQATRWPTFKEVTGKPSTYAPSSHTHPWSQVTGQPATATRWPSFDEVTGKPTNYATTWNSVAAKPAQATRWPTWAEVTNKPVTTTGVGAITIVSFLQGNNANRLGDTVSGSLLAFTDIRGVHAADTIMSGSWYITSYSKPGGQTNLFLAKRIA